MSAFTRVFLPLIQAALDRLTRSSLRIRNSVEPRAQDLECDHCDGDKRNANASNNAELLDMMWHEARLRLLKAEKVRSRKNF